MNENHLKFLCILFSKNNYFTIEDIKNELNNKFQIELVDQEIKRKLIELRDNRIIIQVGNKFRISEELESRAL
jgi:predicted transcriptional regulator